MRVRKFPLCGYLAAPAIRSADAVSMQGLKVPELSAPIPVVLSRSSDVRMALKKAERKFVLSAQLKPVVFYSFAPPSHFARSEPDEGSLSAETEPHPARIASAPPSLHKGRRKDAAHC